MALAGECAVVVTGQRPASAEEGERLDRRSRRNAASAQAHFAVPAPFGRADLPEDLAARGAERAAIESPELTGERRRAAGDADRCLEDERPERALLDRKDRTELRVVRVVGDHVGRRNVLLPPE